MVSKDFGSPVAKRLRALQQAVEAASLDMARCASCTPGAWWTYRAGTAVIPADHAAGLKKHWGVTLDWIYLGDARGEMPEELLRRMEAALSHPRKLKHGGKRTTTKAPVV